MNRCILFLLVLTALLGCKESPLSEKTVVTVPNDVLGTYFVNVKTLNVRELPSEKSKVISKKIFRQQLDVKEVQGEWARITWYENKKSQWVFSEFIVKEQPEAPKSKYETNAIYEHITRSSYDKGKYFLTYIERLENTFITIHERVGVNDNAYTMTEINCEEMTFRALGYTENHWDNLIDNQYAEPKWGRLVEGSSKSDLVNYVCVKRSK